MNRRTFIAATGTLPWALPGCLHRPSGNRHWTQLAPLPDVLGLAAAFAGVSDDSLLVAGGANFPDGFPWEGGKKRWHDVVYRLKEPGGTWAVAGRLPRPLAYGVSISTPEGVICIGGSDSTRHYPGAFRVFTSGAALRIEPLPPLPLPLAHAAGALVGRRILIAGGCPEPGEKSATNRVWSLDLDRTRGGWKELPALPAEPRFLMTAAAHGNDFYLFGGVSLAPIGDRPARVYQRDAWRFRLSEGWQRLADLPRPMAAAPSPAPVVGLEVLLLPGDDGSQVGFEPAAKHPGFPKRALAYDLQGNHWREGGETPFAHVTTACVRWRDRLVVPSGEVRPGVRSPVVWSLPLS